MSSNRLKYDTCATKKYVQESTAPLDYMMYPGKYQNNSKCMIESGIVGGNDINAYLFSGNVVDIESDLRGQTRMATQCNEGKYKPQPSYNNPTLPSCEMIDRKHYNYEQPPPLNPQCRY